MRLSLQEGLDGRVLLRLGAFFLVLLAGASPGQQPNAKGEARKPAQDPAQASLFSSFVTNQIP